MAITSRSRTIISGALFNKPSAKLSMSTDDTFSTAAAAACSL
jgi:hypothetical protein